MSKQEKLLRRLAEKPGDFRWHDLANLMTALGYSVEKGSGSRRKFKHRVSGARFNMHEPHPSGILKEYQVRAIIEFLVTERHLS
jgi:predicted RNA binding protein YcfA (HicA-like mRNA interferase family)